MRVKSAWSLPSIVLPYVLFSLFIRCCCRRRRMLPHEYFFRIFCCCCSSRCLQLLKDLRFTVCRCRSLHRVLLEYFFFIFCCCRRRLRKLPLKNLRFFLCSCRRRHRPSLIVAAVVVVCCRSSIYDSSCAATSCLPGNFLSSSSCLSSISCRFSDELGPSRGSTDAGCFVHLVSVQGFCFCFLFPILFFFFARGKRKCAVTDLRPLPK